MKMVLFDLFEFIYMENSSLFCNKMYINFVSKSNFTFKGHGQDFVQICSSIYIIHNSIETFKAL